VTLGHLRRHPIQLLIDHACRVVATAGGCAWTVSFTGLSGHIFYICSAGPGAAGRLDVFYSEPCQGNRPFYLIDFFFFFGSAIARIWGLFWPQRKQLICRP